MLENVDRTHLDLASGKPVTTKKVAKVVDVLSGDFAEKILLFRALDLRPCSSLLCHTIITALSSCRNPGDATGIQTQPAWGEYCLSTARTTATIV